MAATAIVVAPTPAPYSSARHASTRTKYEATKYDNPDDLLFGNYCLNCGNEAPNDSPYCSQECRQLDSEHETAPDSPSALPALVPSASKSTCSSPTSSATSSPSPRGMMSDVALNDEPPRLDLGAPATMAKFYGGHSLPITMPYPSSNGWKLTYPELVGAHDAGAKDPHRSSDLQFRRRASKPQTPAPLFYREKAAFVRSSPALGPTSPTKPTFWSPQLAPTSDITSLALPPLSSPAAASAALPPPVRTRNCGRPGCVGETRRPRVPSKSSAERRKDSRRLSWNPPSAPAALRPVTTYDSPASDVLMSPRIRALRATEPNLASVDDALEDLAANSNQDQLSSSSSSDEGPSHSAFACYLFSHLSEDKKRALSKSHDDHGEDGDDEVEEHVSRGRAVPPASSAVERSMSVDSAALATRNTSRPTRFLFTRGPPTPAPVDDVEEGEEADRERTIRVRQTTARPKLEPGHFISATTGTPLDSALPSPFPGTPTSPPTAGRGRSVTRRPSVAESDVLGDLPSGRGRSQMRGPGALLRSLSPSVRESSESGSRGRHASNSRRSSSSRAREGESRGRESRGRGRPSRDDDLVEHVDEDDVDERGRGRARGRSSSLRRSREEIIISGAAYGHGSP